VSWRLALSCCKSNWGASEYSGPSLAVRVGVRGGCCSGELHFAVYCSTRHLDVRYDICLTKIVISFLFVLVAGLMYATECIYFSLPHQCSLSASPQSYLPGGGLNFSFWITSIQYPSGSIAKHH
jgi:hypothetical protein